MNDQVSMAQFMRQRLPQVSTDRYLDLPTPGIQQRGTHQDFAATLQSAIGDVDGLQKEANNQVQKYISGEQDNVHEVMLAMSQSRLSFQLMTEVRNRALDTYHELMRLSV